MRLHTLFQARA